jgi:hypothetical protein
MSRANALSITRAISSSLLPLTLASLASLARLYSPPRNGFAPRTPSSPRVFGSPIPIAPIRPSSFPTRENSCPFVPIRVHSWSFPIPHPLPQNPPPAGKMPAPPSALPHSSAPSNFPSTIKIHQSSILNLPQIPPPRTQAPPARPPLSPGSLSPETPAPPARQPTGVTDPSHKTTTAQ